MLFFFPYANFFDSAYSKRLQQGQISGAGVEWDVDNVNACALQQLPSWHGVVLGRPRLAMFQGATAARPATRLGLEVPLQISVTCQSELKFWAQPRIGGLLI